MELLGNFFLSEDYTKYTDRGHTSTQSHTHTKYIHTHTDTHTHTMPSPRALEPHPHCIIMPVQPLPIAFERHKMRTVELKILLHHKDLCVCIGVCVCV